MFSFRWFTRNQYDRFHGSHLVYDGPRCLLSTMTSFLHYRSHFLTASWRRAAQHSICSCSCFSVARKTIIQQLLHVVITRRLSLDRVQTYADYSITRSPEICFVLHFVTMTLSFWPSINGEGELVMMDYPCGNFDDCNFSRFGSNVGTDTHTHNHTQT